MWNPETKHYRISILALVTALTLAIHYGWIVQPIFGHVHWFHALHGRFCYIPIVVAASWFGLRGGLLSATIISVLVLPYIFGRGLDVSEVVAELVEIVFYYFIGVLIGVLVDRELLTRRRHGQAQLQIERSQRLSLMGQIAAGVAHEIKNPLASIKGAADILIDDSTSPRARSEFREILHDEVRRIDSTVTEFLSYARSRETRLAPMDLSEVVRSCVRQVSTQVKDKSISIESDVEEEVFVNGDAEKLHQMILNLILNAIQASETSDSVKVDLTLENQSTVKLEVSDSGTGINADDLDRAFEPFFTTRATGTGLGLAIVKSIVENHGGEISLKSSVDGGTTVTVNLPAIKEND